MSPTVAEQDLSWDSLRHVIVQSSGFQSWVQGELPTDSRQLEDLVRLYLEQTLSTLAY
ncbi:MAG: hypothetical protein OHK0012_10570 [Synechococcales cyanobacterium]